jgi:hypothetical protein
MLQPDHPSALPDRSQSGCIATTGMQKGKAPTSRCREARGGGTCRERSILRAPETKLRLSLFLACTPRAQGALFVHRPPGTGDARQLFCCKSRAVCEEVLQVGLPGSDLEVLCFMQFSG